MTDSNATPTARLGHGEVYTPDPARERQPWRQWGIKLDGNRHEIDCGPSRWYEVQVIGPDALRLVTCPDGQPVGGNGRYEPGTIVVVSERSWLSADHHCQVQIREYRDEDAVAA